MRKVLRSFCNLIFAVIVLTTLLFLFLQIRGIRSYVVVSGSMEPEIHVGSICFINTKVPYSEIKVGDIIAFSKMDLQVTHRVISISEQGVETKGDANVCSDGITTTKDNYCGKNIGSIPYLGYVMTFLQTKRGKIITLTGVIAVCILVILMDQKEQEVQEDLI